MSKNLECAKRKLSDEGHTLVLYNGTEYVTSTDRGIKPLVELYEKQRSYNTFSVADKVVGKAAAFMYVLLGIKEIYTVVISKEAFMVFKEYGICVEYDVVSDFIINRDKTDICPMEKLVLDVKSPLEAYEKIILKLKKMQGLPK